MDGRRWKKRWRCRSRLAPAAGLPALRGLQLHQLGHSVAESARSCRRTVGGGSVSSQQRNWCSWCSFRRIDQPRLALQHRLQMRPTQRDALAEKAEWPLPLQLAARA
jgi:hypothetical protein